MKVIADSMRAATRLTRAGQLQAATRTIQQALAGGRSAPVATTGPTRPTGATLLPLQLEGPLTAAPAGAERAQTRDARGESFESARHNWRGLGRDYKLFVPAGQTGASLPLIVMLHGCTQDPEDFARGTRMNQYARDQQFCVLYPAQSQQANPSACWNWFKHNHQQRGAGEPALLADLTLAVATRLGNDRRRIYVAGLSAGAAMALIMAQAYPEIFAAVGAHSGLPAGVATDLPGALMLMKHGQPQPGARPPRPVSHPAAAGPRAIVFHGDQDSTVHVHNSDLIIASCATHASTGPIRVAGRSVHGRQFARSIHTDASGQVIAEHWLLKGTGHAWSGGDASGTYTDPAGPNATAEMLRFFSEQARG